MRAGMGRDSNSWRYSRRSVSNAVKSWAAWDSGDTSERTSRNSRIRWLRGPRLARVSNTFPASSGERPGETKLRATPSCRTS